MLRIIGLLGSEDYGKTHSLNYFARMIEKHFDIRPFVFKSNGDGSDESDNYYGYSFAINGKEVIVIITTQGDWLQGVECNYEFLKANVDIKTKDVFWFSASRAKGSTKDRLNQIQQSTEGEIYWIRKGCIEFYPNLPEEIELKNNLHTSELLFSILMELTK